MRNQTSTFYIHICQCRLYHNLLYYMNSAICRHQMSGGNGVDYDDVPYSGVVHNVDDDDIEVLAMLKIGNTRDFGPRMTVTCILWYKHSQLHKPDTTSCRNLIGLKWSTSKSDQNILTFRSFCN